MWRIIKGASLLYLTAILAGGPAFGQKFTSTCEPWGSWPGISSRVTVFVDDWHVYRDSANLENIKRKTYDAILGRCPQANFIHLMLLQESLGPHRGFYAARWERKTGRWVEAGSHISYLADQEALREKQKQAQQQAQQAADAKKAAKVAFRESILSKLKVERWVSVDALMANVFIYQGKIVGSDVVFGQMLTATEAMFSVAGSARGIIARAVPGAEFTKPNEPLILAVRIEGLRPFKFLGTDLNLPTGTYVGVYRCQRPACSDFFD